MEEGNTRKGGAPRLSPEAKNENEKEEEEEGKQEGEDDSRKGGAPTLSPDAVANRKSVLDGGRRERKKGRGTREGAERRRRVGFNAER